MEILFDMSAHNCLSHPDSKELVGRNYTNPQVLIHVKRS